MKTWWRHKKWRHLNPPLLYNTEEFLLYRSSSLLFLLLSAHLGDFISVFCFCFQWPLRQYLRYYYGTSSCMLYLLNQEIKVHTPLFIYGADQFRINLLFFSIKWVKLTDFIKNYNIQILRSQNSQHIQNRTGILISANKS